MNIILCPIRINLQMTRRAVQTFYGQDIGDVCLYLIDNGAADCRLYLQSLYSAIRVVYPSPKGLHYVWNKALSFCFDTMKLEHVLVVNNDVVLRPDTYRLLLEDGGDFVTGISVRKMEDLVSLNPYSKSPHPDFSCFLIRKKVWDTIGKFTEEMQIYCGDNEYHVRMHRAGIKAYSLALPFFHEVSGTIKHADNDLRDKIQKQADADREVFKQKYGCMPWGAGYDELFSDSSFGADSNSGVKT